jgi:hypothetical protein
MVNKIEKTEGGPKTAAKPATKRRAAVKPAVARKVEGAQPVKRAAPKAKKARAIKLPTHEEIALRAYFIAEHRQKAGLPGDAKGDWIEAERQLRS